jgi:hypothetical protein
VDLWIKGQMLARLQSAVDGALRELSNADSGDVHKAYEILSAARTVQ